MPYAGLPDDAIVFEGLPEGASIVKSVVAPNSLAKDPMNPTREERRATEKARREFVKNTGTIGTQIADVVKYPYTPAMGEAGANVLREGIGIAKSLPKMAILGYEGLSPEARAASFPGGNPTPEQQTELNAQTQMAGRTMAAPFGLAGGEAFKESWQDTPLQSALTVAPMIPIAKATPYVLGKAAPKAAKVAGRLEEMTLKQPTMLKDTVRKRNAEIAMEENFLPNEKGVRKLNDTITSTESKLQEGLDRGENAGLRATLDRAITNVDALREEALMTDNPQGNLALIDAEIERLRAHPILDESGTVGIGKLQSMKVKQGRDIQKSYGSDTPQFQRTIDKARIRGFKEELETQLDDLFPELSQTNKQLGEYYQLKKSLDRAANRIANNQGFGIGLPIKTGTGAAVGGMVGGPAGAVIGSGIGALIGIIEHPAVAPRLAGALYRASKGAITRAEARNLAEQRISQLGSILGNERGSSFNRSNNNSEIAPNEPLQISLNRGGVTKPYSTEVVPPESMPEAKRLRGATIDAERPIAGLLGQNMTERGFTMEPYTPEVIPPSVKMSQSGPVVIDAERPVKGLLTSPKIGHSELTDIFNTLYNQKFVERGKTGKGYYTNSDYQNYLKENYPSIAGVPKEQVLTAIMKEVEGGKKTPFQENIIQKLQNEIAKQRSQSGNLFFDERGSFGPDIQSPRLNNASIESSASLEALSAGRSDKGKGITYQIVDTRSGKGRPAIGPRPEDNALNPYDVLVSNGPKGQTVINQGSKVRGQRGAMGPTVDDMFTMANEAWQRGDMATYQAYAGMIDEMMKRKPQGVDWQNVGRYGLLGGLGMGVGAGGAALGNYIEGRK